MKELSDGPYMISISVLPDTTLVGVDESGNTWLGYLTNKHQAERAVEWRPLKQFVARENAIMKKGRVR